VSERERERRKAREREKKGAKDRKHERESQIRACTERQDVCLFESMCGKK